MLHLRNRLPFCCYCSERVAAVSTVATFLSYLAFSRGGAGAGWSAWLPVVAEGHILGQCLDGPEFSKQQALLPALVCASVAAPLNLASPSPLARPAGPGDDSDPISNASSSSAAYDGSHPVDAAAALQAALAAPDGAQLARTVPWVLRYLWFLKWDTEAAQAPYFRCVWWLMSGVVAVAC